MIPTSWREKLGHLYLPELLASIIGLGSGGFGITVITLADQYRQVKSFAQAFAVVAPQWWGIVMVSLSVAMIALLTHSRAAAAVPTFLLGIVWTAWVVPIVLSPGFAPSAPIAYSMISALTLTAGLACLIPREEKT